MATTLIKSPKMRTGVAMRVKLTPQDFIAMISLEEDMRPIVIRLARSMDIGNVHMMTLGSPRTKIFRTAESDAP